MKQTAYIETMGCQMNKLDSELVVGQLRELGYRFVDDSASAGVIIFNTCSVRQHAEDKVISKIAQIANSRGQGRELVLAVIGCMAQRLGRRLLEEYERVDVVCGPGQLHRLGEMIGRARHDRGGELALNDDTVAEQLQELDTSRRRVCADKPFMAFVRVMHGCNKYCNYCVVPYVRGPERSRPMEQITAEARRLIDNGVKEITLLGQTVNSYRYENGAKTYCLTDVLEKLHEIDGLERLRFVTSYPRDFDERIFEAMAALPRVCEYLHMPAQSGSDRILKAMNRRYSTSEYLDTIEHGRAIVPKLSVAGDFIVGYCGETEDDFEATKELMRRVRYKNCFIFKYSPRPGTRADNRWADDVPEQVKRQRNTELLELQNEISLQDNQLFVGKTVDILVEGPSKNPHLNEKQPSSVATDKASGSVPSFTGSDNTLLGTIQNNQLQPTGPGDKLPPREQNTLLSTGRKNNPSSAEQKDRLQLVGRTRGDHIVVFDGSGDMIGRIVPVKVIKASALTLFAEYT